MMECLLAAPIGVCNGVSTVIQKKEIVMNREDAIALGRLCVAVVLSRKGRGDEIEAMLHEGNEGPAVIGAAARVQSAAGERELPDGISYAGVKRVETVSGDFGEMEGSPIWRIVVEERCAEFDHPGGAANFAVALNARMARLIGSKLADLLREVLEGEAPEATLGMTIQPVLRDAGEDQEGLHRRQDRRDSLMLMSEIHSTGGYRVGTVRIRNISSTGIMADRCPHLDVGAQMEIDLRNVGRVAGTIVWTDGDRMGMTFLSSIDPSCVIRAR